MRKENYWVSGQDKQCKQIIGVSSKLFLKNQLSQGGSGKASPGIYMLKPVLSANSRSVPGGMDESVGRAYRLVRGP